MGPGHGGGRFLANPGKARYGLRTRSASLVGSGVGHRRRTELRLVALHVPKVRGPTASAASSPRPRLTCPVWFNRRGVVGGLWAESGADECAQLKFTLIMKDLIQPRQDRRRFRVIMSDRADGVAHERGERHGRDTLPGDITHDQQPAPRSRDEVIEVATDLSAATSRPEQGAQLPARDLGQDARKQVLLQRAGDVGAFGEKQRVLDGGRLPPPVLLLKLKFFCG